MKYYFRVLGRYGVFKGRARRAEFWFFTLFDQIAVLSLSGADHLAGTEYIALSYGVLTFLPSLAVTVRRLHDTDRRGWWLFIGLIPVVGFIVLLVFLVRDGTAGGNRFGLSPKGRPLQVQPQPVA
ncbi:DUF805 domain-containing protein [Streptomyces sp. FR-108]|uniref:DUF805 domain-containing protein n=1 Tax=Streptomyces sp. FR-108 TaxID=3416665 RepID=UPI003CF3ADDC